MQRIITALAPILSWALVCAPALAAPGPGHLPYGEAASEDLVDAPAGFAAGHACRLHRAIMSDLEALLAGAQANGVTLVGLSCFRSIAYQTAVFCRETSAGACSDAAQRAVSVAPPGSSEHATGYALDFGNRPHTGCPDLDGCFAATPGGRWLFAHAPDYGFELSFPGGVAQGVTWEPWHWRWVGRSAIARGAPDARVVFRAARYLYPARPAVRNEAIVAPELPISTRGATARYLEAPSPPPVFRKKR